ncbi:hypothetical protein ABZ883_15585 [Streptomyces sp. NPDC046977]|uniref:hypothetical protein n=1 Tax=Streptomyces sp. NPDC046977 TaxID=3154703 RepID=UPI0033FBAE4F
MAPLVVAVLFSLLQAAGYSGVSFSNDSYRYARSALHLLGDSRADAQAEALKAYCANTTNRAQRLDDVNPARYTLPPRQPQQYRTCLTRYAQGLEPAAPEYDRIFDTRPGYPLVVAPAVAVLGVMPGMWLTDLAITLAGSFLVLFLLRAIGASRAAALAGQILYLACPIAYWSMRPLSEGLVNDCALAAVLAAWWLVKGRTGAGAAVLLGSFALLSLVKYSTALLLGAGFVAAAIAMFVFSRVRGRGVLLLAGLSFAVTAANAVVIRLWSLPSTGETLQDTFTDHFLLPAVPDPWAQLLDLNMRYWPHWVVTQALDPLFLACTALAAWALIRRGTPVITWLCLVLLVTGLGAAVAHPVADQTERLWLLAWIPPVIGLVLWLDLLRRPAGQPAADTTAADAVSAAAR